MPMKRIAVVDIGSAGILMQIYEISPKGIIQVVDRVHQNIILPSRRLISWMKMRK